MKLFAIILCFISFSTFANTQNELKDLLNDLQYELTVEWDQQDQAFYRNSTRNFETKIKALFEKGLTKQELQDVLKTEVISSEALARLQLLISLNKIETPQDLINYVQNHSQDFYQRGASWSGEVTFWVVGSVIVASIITGLILLISYNWPSYECTSRAQEQTCVWVENDCMSYDENGYCYSYYTPYESCSYACLSGYWTEGGW